MLPEVKQKQEEMKKKATAAINRMNMKLYQQVMIYTLLEQSHIQLYHTLESAAQLEEEIVITVKFVIVQNKIMQQIPIRTCSEVWIRYLVSSISLPA